MPSDRPLLTIAIPTYNRSLHLERLLASLAPQLGSADRVELIVSDNASPDGTQALVESFRRDGMACEYVRNGSNIGADGNILQCFEMARGTYVWILGDDDHLAAGALSKVLALLQGGDFDLAYVTPFGYTREEQLSDVPTTARETVVYTSAARYARRVNVMFAYISSNIVNKDKLMSAGGLDTKPAMGTNLIQLAWTFAALDRMQRAIFVPEVLVLSLSENSHGWGTCRVMGVNLNKLARHFIQSKQVCRILETASLRDFLPYYLLQMKKSAYPLDRESAHDVLSPQFGKVLYYWLFDYPIIKLPTSLARLWFYAGRAGSRIGRYGESLLG